MASQGREVYCVRRGRMPALTNQNESCPWREEEEAEEEEEEEPSASLFGIQVI